MCMTKRRTCVKAYSCSVKCLIYKYVISNNCPEHHILAWNYSVLSAVLKNTICIWSQKSGLRIPREKCVLSYATENNSKLHFHSNYRCTAIIPYVAYPLEGPLCLCTLKRYVEIDLAVTMKGSTGVIILIKNLNVWATSAKSLSKKYKAISPNKDHCTEDRNEILFCCFIPLTEQQETYSTYKIRALDLKC